MWTATGVVRKDGGPSADALIEVYSVPEDFQNQLPVRDREQLASLNLPRLGTAISEANGAFHIEYSNPAATESGRGAPVHLWLAASAADAQPPGALSYQDAFVRLRAGELEHFVVTLENGAMARRAEGDRVAEISPEEVLNTRAANLKLSTALRDDSTTRLAERGTVRGTFRAVVAGKLLDDMSGVARDEDGKAVDDHYVEPLAQVRAHADARMAEALKARFQTNAPEALALRGRLALTAEQLQAVIQGRTVDPETQTVTLSEQELLRALQGVPADGTSDAAASVSRLEVVQNYCRELSDGERCLRGDMPGHHPEPEEDDDDDEVEDEHPTELENPFELTKAELKARMAGYIAGVLDERSVLNGGSSPLKGPGAQLTADEVSSSAVFPNLKLPPGPADVPAFYDFHKLQIAFRPVWTEALDDTLVAQAEAAYEKYVELGGDPSAVAGVKGWHDFVSVLGVVLLTDANPPPEPVVAHLDITAEEWGVLPAAYRNRLEVLASQIRMLQGRIQVDAIGSHKFLDGLNSGDRETFESVVKYVETRAGAYRDEAQRIARYARHELERRAASESPVPANRILTELKTRARSQYPARYFAATRQERSVNFGLLVTYRQCWTPTCYQVGELLKSIPLAPREVRRYSKKVVMKEKRARKEVVSNLSAQKSETQSTSRAEAEIVQKAMQKTNYSATASGTFQIGVVDASASNTLTADTQGDSAETKKSFHEAVVKAAREYRNEMKVELDTELTTETETQESGEISNPNDELTVTYLFYELQRRYRVNERLHRLQSVVLVAQEMPQPAEIDEDWLIAHRWILNRVLLDDVFKRPLAYVAEEMAAEEHALTELKRALLQQRQLVEELKGEVLESRRLTESRYAALQTSMERTARAAQRGSQSGGLLGFAKKLTAVPVVESFTDRFLGTAGETPEAARIREAATRDAYEREIERLRDFEERLAQANNSLAQASREYADRLSEHLANVVRVTELQNHVKDNILHYMQAIWLHEPPDQRWMRLKDVPIPDLRASARQLTLSVKPMMGALGNVAHLKTQVHPYTVRCGTAPVRGALPTVPLVQVADIETLVGLKANYMIFGLKEPNVITSFMMEPYVERAAGSFGITDPDDLGNMTLDEFSDYVCCLKEKLSADEFESLRETLEAQLATLLQSPLRDDEEIVVPLDAMYIEALPGTRPILENFKLLHRQIDAADAQEKLRLKKMEKLRYAQRLIAGKVGDPEVEAQYLFSGVGGAGVVAPPPPPPPPGPGGGGGP
jgi:hypothetical protein